MKLIPLTRGQFAKVDDEDYDYLMQWKWYANWIKNSYYAYRGKRLPKIRFGVYGKVIKIAMHREIMKTEDKLVVHHKDGDGLNCQKSNMVNCTDSQNLKCRRKHKTSKYKYKGIRTFENGKYDVQITVNYKKIRLGRFKTQEMAARAYNKAAKKYHGKFASLNKIVKQ